MSTQAPLTPADCDLRDFSRMMVDIPRLFGSEFEATANDSEWRFGVTLWLKSFHQVPAASVPDDDAQLARMCGLGRDLRTWRRARAVALRGWVKADDGLLYHPVVAEIALEAWLEKLTRRLSSGAGNAERWGVEFDREPIMAEIGEAGRLLEALNPRSRWLSKQQVTLAMKKSRRVSPPALPPEVPPDIPPGHLVVPVGSQEKGREGKLFEDAEASSVVGPGEAKPDYPDLFETAWRAYPHVKGRSSKKLAFAQWERLKRPVREALPEAVKRYAAEGREPKAECGAQAMERWLRAEKFADWLTPTDDSGPLGADWPDSRWAAALQLWRQDGSWDDRLGPTPGKHGCQVPSHLLIEPAKPQPVRGVA